MVKNFSEAWSQGVFRQIYLHATVFIALLPTEAFCEGSPDLLNDTFFIGLGSFTVATDTTLRLDGTSGEIGTPVDWEQTFGQVNVTRFRTDFYWRFAERHKLRALIFNSAHTLSNAIDRDIDWGGKRFPANSKVEAESRFSVYELAYEYAFVRRDKYELAASIGLHYTSYAAALHADVVTPGGSTIDSLDAGGDVDAPLPVVGLRGTWALPHHFSIEASGQFFTLGTGGYDGALQDYRAVVSWQRSNWLGLGFGYDRFAINVGVDKSAFVGKLKWVYEGPMIFYSASF